MKREHFVKVVEEALGSLPQEFRVAFGTLVFW
jgi:predicted Zn-dependent protease with MMP-like domain